MVNYLQNVDITDPVTSLIIFSAVIFSIILIFAIRGALISKGARKETLKENIMTVFSLMLSYFWYLVAIALIATIFKFVFGY